MAIKEVKKAIRTRLNALTPKLPTAYEGIDFVAPEGMYQRLQFVVNPPTDPTFGTYFYRENVEVQIFVADKLGVGTTAAEERAELLRSWFDKGLTLTEGNVRMHVLRTPQVSAAVVAADRIIVPVLIQVTAEIYNN